MERPHHTPVGRVQKPTSVPVCLLCPYPGTEYISVQSCLQSVLRAVLVGFGRCMSSRVCVVCTTHTPTYGPCTRTAPGKCPTYGPLERCINLSPEWTSAAVRRGCWPVACFLPPFRCPGRPVQKEGVCGEIVVCRVQSMYGLSQPCCCLCCCLFSSAVPYTLFSLLSLLSFSAANSLCRLDWVNLGNPSRRESAD